MKLIDLLVQELPKRGGWPEGAVECERYLHEAQIDFYDKDGNWGADCGKVYGHDFAAACVKPREKGDGVRIERVTREQYEAALAAAQQSVWDGEGLPPVGVKAEVSVDGGRSWCSYKATSENHGMRLVEIGNFTEEFQSNNWMFRPIRSEADKRRDEAIAALVDFKIGYHSYPKAAEEYLREVTALYDAILRGEIPHIRIEHAA
ncbi:hypothetical protein AB8W31_11870 [Cronobacter sakazakii]|uniref:hypothetical protein n=2 Tax=Cronobacter sakazakii TaxID=28141 RepID=UPI000A5039F8|nr:hypothetical protein [Cronobacter sakazakii]DAE53896.1 MAG TPA: hypothetical protein [Caudoviricetes sp.]EIX1854205.1 hypothetical protein [Cronobacter sakazakii]EIZ8820441.1 hypothetical protein [Cronobacter sakazakii]EJC8212287.1 hypothetical protein [Cronobacter sakazakii]EMC4150469.1 hypothetical protein [Cronobacter sakazakii]